MEYKIKYNVRIVGLNIDNSIDFELRHHHFTKGIIEKGENYIFGITLFLNTEIKLEQIQDEAEVIVGSVLNKIAYYYYGSSVGNYIFESTTLPANASFTDMNCSVEIKRSKDEENLRESLKNIKSNTDQLYKIFRAATNAGDIVSRFMFLYQILLELKGPKQKNVDKFIRNELQGRAQYKLWQPNRKDRNGNRVEVEETKLTYLRNTVGHFVDGITPDQTRAGMESEIYSLTELVKKAIGVKTH